jgi:hypothetical protein
MKTLPGTALLLLTLIGGCQSTPPEQGAAQGQAAGPAGTAQSGFLGDYSQLVPAPDREGVKLYVDRSANYRPYTKLMFDSVKVYVAPGAEPNQVVPPDALARMSAEFINAFTSALVPKYQVVSLPGPDVLRVRTAITGVQAGKPETTAVDFLPFKAVYNVARSASGNAPQVAEMTAEMEVLDPSGKRLVAATATRKGDKKLAQGEAVTWEQLRSISEYWAKGFRQRLDELRGEAPAPEPAVQ